MMVNTQLESIVEKIVSTESVVAFNQNGFPVTNQLIEFSVQDFDKKNQIIMNGKESVQILENGNLATVVDVPSLGYLTVPATKLASIPMENAVKASISLDGNTVIMDNSLVGVVLS